MSGQKRHPKTFSFEFFPPRDAEAAGKLQLTQEKLKTLSPDFFSVTFGAGGSTRDRTLETALQIRESTGIDAAPHISCIGTPLDDLRTILQKYRDSGIRRIVALRGDLPSGSSGFGELRYANELVEFIREETGDLFHIEVAAYPEVHPQASGAKSDLLHFAQKIKAGADSAITQYFYNPHAYYRFVEDSCKAGVKVPIVPGIMPIINCTQLVRFSETCGAEIPRWILKRLQEFGDDRPSIREFGIEVTTLLCQELLEQGAPGLHFYTMNQAAATQKICSLLNLGTP